jgi:hypothetical protein
MFIPFYITGHDHLRVPIAGVGDAGLSAIEGLQRHSPDGESCSLARVRAVRRSDVILTYSGDSANCGISLKPKCSCTLSEGVKSPMRKIEALIEKV